MNMGAHDVEPRTVAADLVNAADAVGDFVHETAVIADLQETSGEHHSVSGKSARFIALMNAPTRRQTPLGSDTAWALKLKAAVENAARKLDVRVLSAKPICSFASDDENDMLFELDTEKGRVQAIRNRLGEYTFTWL